MSILLIGILSGLFLAYANGANDNFKGVATLFGSQTTHYRKALWWATITTAAGSLAALFLAQSLLMTFTGKGLVPDAVVATTGFPLAVGLAAASTVMLATRLAFPISTTHALIGALVGTGFIASSDGAVNMASLATVFLIPLLISPFLATLVTFVLYPALRAMRQRLGIHKESCLCIGHEIGHEVVGVAPARAGSAQALAMASEMTLSTGTEVTCLERYRGQVLGVSAGGLLDTLHYLSAGLVSFARGLNDTPKIAAILLGSSVIAPQASILIVGIAIAVGGLLSARRVANTLSLRVTEMNHGQGFTANLVTGFLVIVASRFGIPVSTTHVSCGSLFGIGAATQQAHWQTIRHIITSWIITLPVAAILGIAFFLLLGKML
jgi:inorganic phosphate transporter, PiT family